MGAEKNSENWIVSQYWSDVLFLNFEVDGDLLRSLVPKELELDSLNSKFYISIIPFQMSNIKFRYLPFIKFSPLWELNLRTYVRYKGVSGIYFFTLDINSFLATFVARNFFNLDYRNKKIIAEIKDNNYFFESLDSFKVNAELSKEILISDKESWLAERYALFNVVKGQVYRGDVVHSPWELQKISKIEYTNSFSQEFGLDLPMKCQSVAYSQGVKVFFPPFKKI